MFRIRVKLLCRLFFLLSAALPAVAQEQAPPAPLRYNHLSQDWQVQDENGKLQPYLPEQAPAATALHQLLRVNLQQPFRVTLAAPSGTCLFLDNRLVFAADTAGRFSLDLATLLPPAPPVQQVLLTLWHPRFTPDQAALQPESAQPVQTAGEEDRMWLPRPKPVSHNSIYVLLLLGLGLFYGYLRVQYPSDFSSLFQPARFFQSQAEEGFMNKSINSWSNLLFLLAFSLSLALVTVAIQQNLGELLLPQVLAADQADVLGSVLTGTFVALLALLLKQVFLRFMGYVFHLEQVVELQYREFIRSMLFFGLGLPVLLLCYLAFEPGRTGAGSGGGKLGGGGPAAGAAGAHLLCSGKALHSKKSATIFLPLRHRSAASCGYPQTDLSKLLEPGNLLRLF